MKRIIYISLALICAITVILSVGCSSSGNVDISAADAAQKILDNVEFKDSLVKIESSTVGNFYTLDDSISEYAIFISGSGATTEEIAVLKVDGGKGEDVREILENRIDDQKYRYESYLPTQMSKLENPVILSKGDIIIMVLADDSAVAESTVKDIFDGK